MRKLLLVIVLISVNTYAQDVLMQDGIFNRCEPHMFYDSGGEFGNYASNENFEITICPDNPDAFIILNFLNFTTQLGQDELTIYDGDSTAAPIIGTYSGSNTFSPGNVQASTSNTSGCLTVTFTSNGSVTALGWEAEILCAIPCQDITASIDNTNPPASSTNIININSGATVNFEGSAIFSEDGTGATYEWDFGDGSATVNGQNVSHTFSGTGTFTVTLTVTDTNPMGCTDTATVIVAVLGEFIDVVEPNPYTNEELITDVLINSPCANVANVVSSTGINFGAGNPNGIGYFVANTTYFPFDSGIVLSTGNAPNAEGPEDGTNSDSSWPGDTDLEAAIPAINSNDATYIEFDFVPLADQISFEFIFASDEYGTFQCSYADAFAFLLTDMVTGVTTNLAVVPGTNDPVSVLTIRDNAHNGSCNSVNPQYFDTYNDAGGPIDFRGYTVPLTASSVVVPNRDYSIKLVIADHLDHSYDSAVFLRAGSFDLGGSLGDDVTIAASNTICYGDAITLDTGLPSAVHEWFYEGALIPGESSSTYDATEDGEYSVNVIFSGACYSSDSILIEFYPSPTINNTIDLYECSGTGTTIFDLTQNNAEVLGTQDPTDFEILYYETFTDADTNTAAITNPTTYVGTDMQTIYVRIHDAYSNTCYEVGQFILHIGENTINPAPDLVACDGDVVDNAASFDLTLQDALILGAQSASDYVVTYYTNLADATAGTNALTSPYTNINNPEPIYVRVELATDTNCFNVSATPLFELQVLASPSITTLSSNSPICDGEDAVFTITGTAGDEVAYAIDGGATQQITLDASGQGVVTEVAVSSATTITLSSVTNPSTGCSTTLNDSETVVVNINPALTNLTSNSPICNGEDGSFTIEGTPNAEVSFSIDGGATQQITLDATGTAEVAVPSLSSDSTITLSDITYLGCTTVLTDSITITVQDNPEVTNLSSNSPICSEADAVFTITGTPSATVTYSLDGGTTTNTIDLDATTGEAIITVYGVTTATTINLSMVEDAGCSTTLTNTATVNLQPVPSISLSGAAVCAEEDATFTITGTAGDVVDYAINGGAIQQVTLDATGVETISLTGVLIDQEISVSNVYNPSTGCSNNTAETHTITVHPLPIVISPSPLIVCDDNIPDGNTNVDLTIKDVEITGNNPNYIVSYYEDLAAAEAGAPEVLPSATNYIANDGQVLYVRVENAVTGCYNTTTLTIEINESPSGNQPANLEYCDPDNDGLGTFNLDGVFAQVTTDPNLEVSLHLTEQNAHDDVLPQSGTLSNVSGQILYIRIDYVGGSDADCYTILPLPLELIVQPTPEIELNPSPLIVCDNDGVADGLTEMDLTVSNPELLNGLDPSMYTVSYYTEVADAAVGPTAASYIAVPTAYTNTTPFNETLGVRVENNATGCYTVTTLDIEVRPIPIPVTTPEAIYLAICDNPVDVANPAVTNDGYAEFDLTVQDAIITGGNTNWIVTYYQSTSDADSGTAINPATAYTNTSVNGFPHNPQTLIVQVTDGDTGCFTRSTLTLEVLPVPTPTTSSAITPLESCDLDNDGFTLFNLQDATVEIDNGEGSTITYHGTQTDAENNVNELPDTYQNNTASPEIVYVRATNPSSGCYTVVELQLIVLPSPEIPSTIDSYVLCDENNDGSASFDLTSMDATIYGSQNPSDYTLTYHESLADAEASPGVNPIVEPQLSNYNSSGQTIYVRLEGANGCYVVSMFDLQVAAQPTIAASNLLYEICDDSLDNDGYALFNLTTQDTIFTGGDTSLVVDYYQEATDIPNTPIADYTAYTNVSINGVPHNPQTIFVTVSETTSGNACYSTTTLTLVVNTVPTPGNLPDLEACDDTNSGDEIEEFDLTTNEASMLNNYDETVSYHISLADAEAGINAIVDPTNYTNEDPDNLGVAINPQIIYVRVTNTGDPTNVMDTGTGCYTIVPFSLIVHPLPETVAVSDYDLCEVNTDYVGIFDLTIKTDEILNGQPEPDYVVSYYEDAASAAAATGAIATPEAYTNQTNPQTIYVNILNTLTGCDIATVSFTIEVFDGAASNSDMEPIIYELCDDAMETDGDTTNDSVVFTLSPQPIIDEVLDGQDPNNFAISYYESLAAAHAGENALPSTYTNITNPQIIYVRVDNNTPEILEPGIDLTTLTEGLDFNNDGQIDTIDTDGDGLYDSIDIDNDPTTTEGFDTNGDGLIDSIDTNGDGIHPDLIDINNDGIYDNDSTACYATSEMTLQVNPLPMVVLEESYTLCVDTNGSEVVDPLVLETGLDASNYSFQWSLNGSPITGATGSSINITAAMGGGTYQVEVVNTNTQCSSIASTEVEESAPPSLATSILTGAFSGDHSIEVTATGTGTYEFSIDGGAWEIGTNNSYTFTEVPGGAHIIEARDIFGCGIATIEVLVIDYPHYFTPNGDGFHDTWNVYGISTQIDAKIYIFDRYGKLLKQISPAGTGWDGTYNGELMPTNDYWFTVEYRESNESGAKIKTFKSHFTLKW